MTNKRNRPDYVSFSNIHTTDCRCSNPGTGDPEH